MQEDVKSPEHVCLNLMMIFKMDIGFLELLKSVFSLSCHQK